jgi:uncharacterized circularly permuted ATP-grasp superfamily protein
MLRSAMHFNGYDPQNGPFFDEVFKAPGRARPGMEALVTGIEELEEGVLHARQRAAEHSLLNLGITIRTGRCHRPEWWRRRPNP